MKKLSIFLVILCLFTLTGCGTKTDAEKFKEEYEALNGEKNSSGKKYKDLSISADNPIKYSNYDEVLDVIENGTGIIYFGYPECPWCRTAITVLFESARDYDIDTIYYMNLKDERDYLEVKNDKIVYKKDEEGNKLKGSKGYFKLLDTLDEELDDYKLESNGKTYDTGKKRIYVPLIVFVNNGKIVGTHTSTVDSQESGYDELTSDEYDELNGIYANYIKELVDTYCDEAC